MELKILHGNALEKLKEIEANSIDLCITSPPYWGLRDYGIDGQLGNEPSMEKYLENSLKWISEIWRVLKPSGSFVLNIGDCFKSRQLLSISSFIYCKIISETDFVCRGEHIWAKPNVPSPIRSRLKHSHEKLFWFVKDANKYHFDNRAWMKNLKETDRRAYEKSTLDSPHTDNIRASKTSCFRGGQGRKYLRNESTIEHSWRIIPAGAKQKGFELGEKLSSKHIAPFPENLIIPYIQSLCPQEGIILDPFVGSGTTIRVALTQNRKCIGIELNEDYINYAKKRLNWGAGLNTKYSEE